MDLSLKSLILLAATFLTGLSAGLFYAWSVSVIPGTQKVGDHTYLETMQSINRAILNPAFFVVFFGSVFLLSLSSIYEFHTNKLAFWLVLIASITYLTGTIGVTGLGNVPLNNELDRLDLYQVSREKLTEFRQYYESKWNQLHQIRTAFALVSFLLTLFAVLVERKMS